MSFDPPIVIGTDAIDKLLAFCKDSGYTDYFLISDTTTYDVLGQRVAQVFIDAGMDVKPIVLEGEHVIADESYLVEVFIQARGEDRMYLAVGAGTLHDITRFCSDRSRCPFIGVPTAPSVDGFMSVGAPLVVGKLKATQICKPPLGVFADIETLARSPVEMRAAGFGDLLGKFTSVTDWKIGHLLWDEPYQQPVFDNLWTATMGCMEAAAEIGAGTPEGMELLFDALIASGFAMVDFGSSRPCSGTEHHFSHLWEMRLLQQDRPAILHGAKVAVGLIYAVRRYEQISRISEEQIASMLEEIDLPDRAAAIAEIRETYGPIADKVIAQQRPFLDMTEDEFEALKGRIIKHWPEILELAAMLPSPDDIIAALEAVSAPTDVVPLGITPEEIEMAKRSAHFFRERFTISKLFYYLGLEDEG